jgi:hypothetical protein
MGVSHKTLLTAVWLGAFSALVGCDQPSGLDQRSGQASSVTAPDSAKPSKEIALLIAKSDTLNEKCQGGAGDNPATMKACDERDVVGAQLKALNWCWGNDRQAGYEKRWQICEPNQKQAVADFQRKKAAQAAAYRAMLSEGAWSCGDDKAEILERYFPDNTFLIFVKLYQGTPSAMQILVAGEYEFNGYELSRHERLNRYLQVPPAVMSSSSLYSWNPSALNADVLHSNNRIARMRIDLSAERLFAQHLTWNVPHGEPVEVKIMGNCSRATLEKNQFMRMSRVGIPSLPPLHP